MGRKIRAAQQAQSATSAPKSPLSFAHLSDHGESADEDITLQRELECEILEAQAEQAMIDQAELDAQIGEEYQLAMISRGISRLSSTPPPPPHPACGPGCNDQIAVDSAGAGVLGGTLS